VHKLQGEKMKKLSIVSSLFGLGFIGMASAADITVYHMPTCPHCHHAREFINGTLVYEYPKVKVTEVNVMDEKNLPLFQETLTKCEYESGGVPVIVIGEKCFQGYADAMQDELRAAVEADMSDADKKAAADNKAEMAKDAEGFKTANADRVNAISEYNAADAAATAEKDGGNSTIWFWGILVVLVAALGFVLVKKGKRS